MAQFTVRNLEDDVRDRLRELARSRGQSMEETVRQILRTAVMGSRSHRSKLGSRIAGRFCGQALTEEIPELRGQQLEPPDFES